MSILAIGPGWLGRLGDEMRAAGLAGRAFLISDDQVFPRYGDVAITALVHAGYDVAPYQIAAGERSKSLATVATLYDWLIGQRIERGDAVVALGGGVVGDVAGFAAATVLRGVPLVQVPTTVLAQIDSSIGGKVGVDHPQGKNLIGAFHPAHLIVSDVETLRSLSPRDLASGWAEAIKCAMILDAELLDRLDAHAAGLCNLAGSGLPSDVLSAVVERCARHKVAVVEADEREANLRMILNYGHTIGHALEAALGYTGLLHGEAVSLGMVTAGRLAVAQGLLTPAVAARQNEVLAHFGLPTAYPPELPPLTVEQVLAPMFRDKKARGARLRWILLDRLGHAQIVSGVPLSLVEATVSDLLQPVPV
jgi:3-dehydroquinate synthase